MRSVFMLLHETKIEGIFSSKQKAYEFWAKSENCSVEEAEEQLNAGDYPYLKEVVLDQQQWMDR